ncbi:hypothetical protein [Actinokineospora bangkokensis]|uniref:DUF3800 domain-containing protein n=1 Tax=Actinokineospora bangkokensis TaxID=1193682 RepID=A0A1Q9LG09_9PSEU|nr:hypothetical protein [Actinokineospora bangkokensis]OLR90889.1 hypothetical protein BJP25_30495 [Actinokineospora bangkokensis]
MTVHAFADESRRNQLYLVAVAVVDARKLRQSRKLMRGMLLPGQREVHFKKEMPSRRRGVIAALCAADVEARVYTAHCSGGEERARRRCVQQLGHDLVKLGAGRLVLDSRETRDEADRATLHRVLACYPPDQGFVFEHLDSCWDELLWIADAVAWCYGAGGDWRRRIAPVVVEEVDLTGV